jgi:hypothetical protein
VSQLYLYLIVAGNNFTYRRAQIVATLSATILDLFFFFLSMALNGGSNGPSSRGQSSRRIHDINEIIRFNPQKIILMPCGFDTHRTLKEAKTLETIDK